MTFCLYDPNAPWCQHRACYEARQEDDRTPGHWTFSPLSPPSQDPTVPSLDPSLDQTDPPIDQTDTAPKAPM